MAGVNDADGRNFFLPRANRHKCAKPASAMKRDTCHQLARNREHVCWHCRMKRWTAIIRNPLHNEAYDGEKEIAEVDLRVGGAAGCRRARRLRPDAYDRRESRD